MFVNQKPVPVTEGSNTISIRPKMDFVTKNACMDALTAIGPDGQGKANIAMHLGAYQMALLQHNIVSWSGPDFVGIACTAENIGRLDPDEPLVDKVLEEITKRNPLAKETPTEKKDAMNAGDLPLPASE